MKGILYTPGQLSKDPAREGALINGRLLVHPAAFWRQFEQVEITAFCVEHGFYCIPTAELVQWLRERISIHTTIEIGAGNGVLAEALGIVATDNMMQKWPAIAAHYADIAQAPVQYGENVRELEAHDAIRQLKPKTVIGAWVTHRYREEWRGGNQHGIREEKIPERARYIFIGNQEVHRHKPILELPHERYEFPWLVSRAFNGSPNFIAIWAKR